MTEATYEIMLEAAQKGKKITLNATEDTSYKNIMYMQKKGIINVEEDSKRKWDESDEYYGEALDEDAIVMHDMTISINIEKMLEELKILRERIERRKQRKMYSHLDER